MAGVASATSSSEFLPTTRNSGPACITYVTPSSLKQKIFPLYAQGEAVKAPATGSMRCLS